MEYSILNQNDNKRVVFYGNIKPSSRAKFLEIGSALSEGTHKKWVLDVHDFDFIDSAGLGMLIELHDTATKNDVKIALCGANGLVKRMFELSKFETLFELID